MNAAKWIKFFKVSPGGNITILLDQTQVEAADRAPLAARLMDKMSLGAEQVGFIDWPGKKRKSNADALPSIKMMGGEFCANAVRAYAGVLASQMGDSLPWRGKIESSGLSAPVNAYVMGSERLDASIEIPLGNDFRISPLRSSEGDQLSLDKGALVSLPGISHILLPGIPDSEGAGLELDNDLMLSAANRRRELGLEDQPAVGCIWFDLKKDMVSMLPLVWVRDTNTCCLETSCGSGALALALFLGRMGGKPGTGMPRDARPSGVFSPPFASYTNFYWIMQPSGEALWVSYTLQKNGSETEGANLFQPSNIWLGGAFNIIARGEALI
ncbi:MAG: hypothetical protein IJD04_08965 [Desulfovibrionaceae bacterium]|nr:hypothetical protein [Desulfovibrionaceae bacterium]